MTCHMTSHVLDSEETSDGDGMATDVIVLFDSYSDTAGEVTAIRGLTHVHIRMCVHACSYYIYVILKLQFIRKIDPNANFCKMLK